VAARLRHLLPGRRRWDPEIADAGRRGAAGLGYSGISEIEFVQDAGDRRSLLLDVNTRAWKWIGLPVAAGVDLPLLAYRDAVGEPFDSGPAARRRAVDVPARLRPLVRAGAATVPEEQVTRRVDRAARGPARAALVDAVHDPDDPEPGYDVLWGELSGGSGYRCAC
jgi:predicted ATP-grasp superfamily ATP-dependent carboligase